MSDINNVLIAESTGAITFALGCALLAAMLASSVFLIWAILQELRRERIKNQIRNFESGTIKQRGR